jgi:hypothetical protein
MFAGARVVQVFRSSALWPDWPPSLTRPSPHASMSRASARDL